jgi:hypothetical protein
MQCYGIDRRVDCFVLQQCLGVGGESNALCVATVVQWFDTQPIACQKQNPIANVPQSKGEHPGKAIHTALSPLGVGLEDNLRIAVREEVMTLGTEGLTKLRIVIDSPVEDHCQP